MAQRKRITEAVETAILTESRRRCCVCFALRGDLSVKKGQIAHLDQDPQNNQPENLAYLCFDHHEEYDSTSSQAKGLSEKEVRKYRADLLAHLRVVGPGEEDDAARVQVVSYNQSGGITAGTVNLNAAPEPSLRAETMVTNQPTGSRFLSRYALTVDSPYPPANLYVAAHAPTIDEMRLIPQRAGMTLFGHCGKRDGCAFANLTSPSGRIHLDVITTKPESAIRVDYNFD